jgi:hypothetical protein
LQSYYFYVSWEFYNNLSIVRNEKCSGVVKIREIDLPAEADFKKANEATVKAAETTRANQTGIGHDDGNTRNTNNANIAKKVHDLICNKPKGHRAWKGNCSQNFVTASRQRILENSQVGEDVNVVQIGEHTGFEVNDPIATGITRLLDETIDFDPNTLKEAREHFHWTSVEPSPHNVKRLSVNLKNHSDVCDINEGHQCCSCK